MRRIAHRDIIMCVVLFSTHMMRTTKPIKCSHTTQSTNTQLKKKNAFWRRLIISVSRVVLPYTVWLHREFGIVKRGKGVKKTHVVQFEGGAKSRIFLIGQSHREGHCHNSAQALPVTR